MLLVNPRLDAGAANENLSRSDAFSLASDRWEQVLLADNQNEIALFHLASNSLSVNDLETCSVYIDRLNSVAKLHRPHRIPELKAKLATQKLDYKGSLQYWREAIEFGFNPQIGAMKMASQYLHLDDVESSRECISKAIELGATSDQLAHLNARCYMKARDWSRAIEVLESIDLDGPSRSNVLSLLFQCYMHDSRLEKANLICKILEDERPEKGIYFRGRWFYNQLNYDQAIKSFIESVNVTDNPESRVWLIKSLVTINEIEQAREQAEIAVKLAPGDFQLQARCWDAAGELTLAERAYLDAVKTSATESNHIALFNFYQKNRFWGRALNVTLDAHKRGYRSQHLIDGATDIESCMELCGKRVHKRLFRNYNSKFLSSESIVETIVDRILEKREKNTSIDKAEITDSDNQTIVIIINSLGSGGAERQALNLVNGLVEKYPNKRVVLLCTHLSRRDQDRFYVPMLSPKVELKEFYKRDEDANPLTEPAVNGFEDLLIHMQPVSRQRSLVQLAKALTDIEPDVVHAWLDETFVNASLVCGMLGIENIVGRWGSMPAGVSRTVTEKARHNIGYLEHAYRQLTRMRNIVYTSNSRLTGDAYAEMMGIEESQVNIVYNGVDPDSGTEPGSNIDRSSIGIPPNAPVIGTVFRFSEEKRPELWVKIAREVVKQCPQVHFVMVGAGPLESSIAQEIGEDSRFIHMVGKQTNVADWYELFNILLLTSRVEGVSNVVVESQYCGVPVVVPDVGGLSEAVLDGRTGYVLTDDSVSSFSTTLVKLIQNPTLLSDLSIQAQQFARTKFSISKMVQSYNDIYNQTDRK